MENVLKLSTLAIRDWIPVHDMAIRRRGDDKDTYVSIEYDAVIPIDLLLWRDDIA